MKKAILLAGVIAIGFTAQTAPAEAGPFDRLKKKVERVKKEAEDVEEAVRDVEEVVDTVDAVSRGGGRNAVRSSVGRNAAIRQGMRQRSNYPKTASRGNFAGRAAPVPAKFASVTKCANLGLGNAFIAEAGDYTFSQGLSTETRGGLINRETVSASNGCVLPAMGSGDVLYVEVDRAKYNKHSYALQCAAYDGSEQLDNTNAPRENNYGGRHVMLHTGNDLGYTPTASGSNSDRTSQYDKYLKSRGREMITFNMPALHTDKAGTDFYCQHYDKKTGKSALAFAFRRGPVGR